MQGGSLHLRGEHVLRQGLAPAALLVVPNDEDAGGGGGGRAEPGVELLLGER